MTADRRRKRRVRARVAKTGESYTAALRHLRRMEENRMSTYQIDPAGATDTGSVRAVNQDFLLAEGDLFAVADGMGGHRGGEIASRVAIEALRRSFADDPTGDGLAEAVRDANRAVWAEAQVDPELHGMGTTIAAVALVSIEGRQRLALANVGDSRVYLLRQGQLSRLSVDHSEVAELVQSGALSDADAANHPRRHILTRALGVRPEVEPYTAEATPEPGDRILLCSDGLFNEVTSDEIVSILTEDADPAVAADHLVATANDHGGHDNITVIVLDIARAGRTATS